MAKCVDKKAFPTRAKAERVLSIIWKSHWLDGRKLPCASYKCPICNKWHLTSQAQRTKPQVKEVR